MANQVEKIQIDVELTAGKVDISKVQEAIDHALSTINKGKKQIEIEFVGGNLEHLVVELEKIKASAASSASKAVLDIDNLLAKVGLLTEKLANIKVGSVQPVQSPASEPADKATHAAHVSATAVKKFELGSAEDQALTTRIKATSEYESALRTVIAKNEVLLEQGKLSVKQSEEVTKALTLQKQSLQTTVELKQKLEGKAEGTLPGVATDVIAVNKLNRELRSVEVVLDRLKALAPSKSDEGYLKYLDDVSKKLGEVIRIRQQLNEPTTNLKQELSAINAERLTVAGENKVKGLVGKINEVTQALQALSQQAPTDPIHVEVQRKALQDLTRDLSKYYGDLQKFNEGQQFLTSSAGKSVSGSVQSILSGNQQAQLLQAQAQTADKLALSAEALLNKLSVTKITSANQQGYLKQLQDITAKLTAVPTQTQALANLQARLKQSAATVIQVKFKVTDDESLKNAIDRVIALETRLHSLQKGDLSLDAKAKEFQKLAKEVDQLVLEYRRLETAANAVGKPLNTPFTAISDIKNRVALAASQTKNEAELQRLDERRLANEAHARDLQSQEAQTSRMKFLRAQLPLLHESFAIEKERARLATTQQAKDSATANMSRLAKEISGINAELRASESLLSKAIQSFIRYGLLYQVFYSIKGSITGAIAEVFHFETALTNIKAIGQATNQQMSEVSETILRIGENSKFSSTEIAAAATTLVQAGIKIEKLTGILTSVEQLAAATGSGIQETANLTTTFLQVFQDANPQDIADSLTSAVNISKLNVQDLSTISNYLLSVGKSYNEDFKDILAVSATLKNAGLKASTIATNTRQALLELLSPDVKALKGLSARYRAIGEAVSEDAVKAIFQGFKSAQDPLAAALSELQRLGIGQLGSQELNRIFDVRSENVIKTLVQNKDALTANRVLLDDAGSAAQGAKVQMESLEVSLQNLREVLIGGIYDATDSTFKDLAKDVREATQTVKELLGEINEFKKQGGSTGLGNIVTSAIPGAIAGGLKTRSVAGVITGGLIGGAGAAAANTTQDASTAEKVGSFIGLAGLVATVVQFFKRIASSGVISEVSKVSAVLPKATGLFSLVARGFALLVAGFEALPALAIAGTITALLAAVGLVNKLIDGDSLEEQRKLVESRLQAAEKEAQEQKAKLEELKAKKDKAKQLGDINQSFDKSLEALDKVIQTVLNNSSKTLEDINGALADAAVTSSQIGSASLASFANKIGVSNQRVAAELVQEVNKNVAIGEALRQQATQRRHLAQSRTDQGVALDTDPLTLQAFKDLSLEDQQTLQTPIITKDNLEKFLKVKKKLDGLIGKSGLDEIDAAIRTQEANVTKGDVDKIKILVDSARFDPTAGSKIRDLVDSAVESGSVSLVEAMIEAADGFVDKRKIESAKLVEKANAAAEFNKAVVKFADTQAAPTPDKGLAAISGGSTIPEVKRDVARDEQEIKLLKEKINFIKDRTESAISAGDDALVIKKLTEEYTSLTKQAVSKQGQINQLKEAEVTRAESSEVLNRRLILNNQQIVEATRRLKIIQDTKAASAQEEVDIILEVNKLKRRALDAEKITLTKQLASVLKDESQIDVGNATSEQILKELATKNGQELVANSEKLSSVYKALLDISSKELTLREETVKDLSNVAVSAEKKKLADQERELARVRDKVQAHENSLQQATQNLSKARQDLADALNQQQDVEKFFNSLGTDTGNAKQNLQNQQDAAFFNPDNIDIQKSLASAASEALKSKLISQTEADSIISEARRKAEELAAINVDAAQSNVIRAQNAQQAAYELAKSAYNTQVELVESNRVLSEQIANLSSSLQATAQYLANNQSPVNISPAQQAQILNPPGVSDIQPGTPNQAKTPLATTVFNFGGASIKTIATQEEIDRFKSQLSIADRQRSLQ